MCAQLCLILWDPMNCGLQSPMSMGFSRQEYWSGLLFLTPGDLAKLLQRFLVSARLWRGCANFFSPVAIHRQAGAGCFL